MSDALLQAALAGAGRSVTRVLPAGTPAETLGESIGVLLRAGLRDAYQRAGYVPSGAPEPFPPAPDVPEVLCPPAVERAIKEVFERTPSLTAVRHEVLNALATRGWALSPGLLTLVLSARPEPADLLPVLGARGRWLASLNPAWRWAIEQERVPDAGEMEHIWAEGTKGERVSLIRHLRAADPAGARERVDAGFAAEPADLRADLLRAFEVNLSPGDEPFLEAALDDRSRAVREAAVDLLPRVHRSAFVGRMVERARGLVARRKLGRGVALHPVPELPEDWRRDGIVMGQIGGLEEELSWMIRVLASIPALVLEHELAISPREVIDAADQYGAGVPLIEAWRQTAAPAEVPVLLPLLWDIWWDRPLQRTHSDGTLVALAREMPREALRQRLVRALSEPPAGTERIMSLVLNEAGQPWPADVSRAALDMMRRWLERAARKDRTAGDWAQLIRPMAAQIAPEWIDVTIELFGEILQAKVLPVWNHDVIQANDTLHMRKSFWDAISTAETDGVTT